MNGSRIPSGSAGRAPAPARPRPPARPRAARGRPRRAPAPRSSSLPGALRARELSSTGARSVERPFGLARRPARSTASAMRMSALSRSCSPIVGEPRARRGRPADPRLRVQQPRPHGHAERVPAREQRLHLLRGVERGQRLLEAPLREAQETARGVDDQLACRAHPRGAACACARSSHRSASSRRPSHSRFSAPAAEGGDERPDPRPSRAPPRAATASSASAEPRGARLPGPRAGDREVAERADRQPRPPGAAGQLQRQLEVTLGVVEARGPQLCDAEIQQRRRTERLAERSLADGLRGERRLRRPHRLQHRLQVAAPARERQRQHGPEQVEAHTALTGDRVGQPVGDLDVRRAARRARRPAGARARRRAQAPRHSRPRQARTPPAAGGPSRRGRRG